MKDLIINIARALVDNPDEVSVAELEGNHTSVLELKVAKEDIGKVIGKQGRTARAIRTRASCSGSAAKSAACSDSFPEKRNATSGARSINASTARLARCTLQDSSRRETANRNETVAASNHSPIAAAPITAMVINKFMSGRKAMIARHAFGRTNHTPAMMPSTIEKPTSKSPNDMEILRP